MVTEAAAYKLSTVFFLGNEVVGVTVYIAMKNGIHIMALKK